MTSYNGQAITYDAIGNPLNDGERQYEWEAGRRLKKMIVQGDPADGIEDGFDEGSETTLKLEFSNGNLLTNGVADTVITAKVYRKNVDVTNEYAVTAFNWTRNSGNESVDEDWNAAHSGMKSITVSANELTDDIQIQCTLTGTSPAYGSVDVNDSFIASHTRGVADSNDTFSIEDGTLFVTTDVDNYRLSGNELTALYPRLNGSVSANAWIYHTQPTKTLEFKYNSSGLRVQKKVTANGKSETTDYTLHGKLVTHMTVGNDKLHFFYDNSSRPAKVDFNGVTYTYLHNLQGDVVGIIDKSGVLVVEYKYDAWGRAISIAGSFAGTLGIRNPFRYRGYIYDEESELYYLRSRFYSSEINRFINADEFIAAGKNVLEHNLFAYCMNAPVVSFDRDGHRNESLIDCISAVAAIAKFFIAAIGAELQLVVNRQKAKKAIRDSENLQLYYAEVTNSTEGIIASFSEGIFGKYEWLYNQVTHGAPMDYKNKNQKPWWAMGCSSFYFRGRMITLEEYGNINYGYVAKALGISDKIIFAGGGFAAFTGGKNADRSTRIDYFFDSEEDHANIAWGIDIYEKMWGNE